MGFYSALVNIDCFQRALGAQKEALAWVEQPFTFMTDSRPQKFC